MRFLRDISVVCAHRQRQSHTLHGAAEIAPPFHFGSRRNPARERGLPLGGGDSSPPLARALQDTHRHEVPVLGGAHIGGGQC